MTYDLSKELNDQIWINRPYGQGLVKKLFKWYEVGVLGCGVESMPWINLENLIEWPSTLESIKNEIHSAIDTIGFAPGGGSCLIPSDINGYEFLTYYQYFQEKYIPEDVLNKFAAQHEYDKWVIENLSKPIWQSVLLAKSQPNKQDYWKRKHQLGAIWNPYYKIPLTKQWIDSLETYLFKTIGRVVIYRTNKNQSVPIHRDFPITEHKAHFVNFQISNTSRPAFVYDEITKQKIYTVSKAYLFNESDCHGVDGDEENSFTIRIDGTFHDSIVQKLKLDNGYIFSKNSFSYQNLNKLKIYDPK